MESLLKESFITNAIKVVFPCGGMNLSLRMCFRGGTAYNIILYWSGKMNKPNKCSAIECAPLTSLH